MTDFARYRLLPSTAPISDCAAERSSTGAVSISGCTGLALGRPLRSFVTSTTRAHRFDYEVGGYRLIPRLGWWFFDVSAVLMAILGAYATLRSRLVRRNAILIESLLVLVVALVWVGHIASYIGSG